jgi:hypothetical protein
MAGFRYHEQPVWVDNGHAVRCFFSQIARRTHEGSDVCAGGAPPNRRPVSPHVVTGPREGTGLAAMRELARCVPTITTYLLGRTVFELEIALVLRQALLSVSEARRLK